MRIATTVLIGLSLLATPLVFGATAQQEKMKTCNADAKAKSLTGDARKDFMKTCLSANGTTAGGKELTPQQQKMSTCSKDAAAQHLSGDDRKKFMSTCLKGK
jgi:hypothetical protein